MLKSFSAGIKLTKEGYEAKWIHAIRDSRWRDDLGRSGHMDEVIRSIEESPEKWKLYTEENLSPLEAYQQGGSTKALAEAVKHAFLCGEKVCRDGWHSKWTQRIPGEDKWQNSKGETGRLQVILNNIESYPWKWGIYLESGKVSEKEPEPKNRMRTVIEPQPTEIAKVQEVNEIKKNLYFHKQVMNPHETGSQSYTAYENGFIEGYNKCHEIAKAKEQPQPAINTIEQAYERGEKIRHKNWLNWDWIQKHKETKTIDNHGNINSVYSFTFIQHPEEWELYTEPEQPSAPFDKERFEAMFRAVVASGKYSLNEIQITEFAIKQLDAFYAEKQGGSNG